MSQSNQNPNQFQNNQTPFWQFISSMNDLAMDPSTVTNTARNTPQADANVESDAHPSAPAQDQADPNTYANYVGGVFPGRADFGGVFGRGGPRGRHPGRHGGPGGPSSYDFLGSNFFPQFVEENLHPHGDDWGFGGGRRRGRHHRREGRGREPTPTSSRSSSVSPDEAGEVKEDESHPHPPHPPHGHSPHPPHPPHGHSPHPQHHPPHPHSPHPPQGPYHPSFAYHYGHPGFTPPPPHFGRRHGRRHGHGHGRPRGPPPPPSQFPRGAVMQNLPPWIQNIINMIPQPPNTSTDTNPPSNDSTTFTPTYDLFTTPQSFTIHISLPGAKKEDIGVHYAATTSTLTISGVVYRPCSEEVLATMTSNERKEVGMFERNIVLNSRENEGWEVDSDGIGAKLEDGILVVTVPRVEREEWEDVKKVDIE